MTTTHAAELEAKARKSVAARSTEQLCWDYGMTGALVGASREIAMLRGWLMDELEKRDADAFDKWMFSDEDLPHAFYGFAPSQLI